MARPGEREAADLRELVEDLTRERDQLAEALESRVVIEQAKGVLAERYGLPIPDSFLLLRKSARGAQMNIHALAEEVVRSRESPPAVQRGLARDSRLRAIAMRERNEATLERTRELHQAHVDQIERVSQGRRLTARIRARSRWDALALGSRLGTYRWYLVAPDDEHWDVVVEIHQADGDAPRGLRHHVEQWLRERGLETATVRIGGVEHRIVS